MVTDTALEAELRRLAGSVPDPELPDLSLAELGVLRALRLTGPHSVEVDLTPTYTACPALDFMAQGVVDVLRARGVEDVRVRTVLSPPWSSEDISDEGRRKLRAQGISPPRPKAAGAVVVGLGPTRLAGTAADTSGPSAPTGWIGEVDCPHCGSVRTEQLSRFSSTACRALHRCLDCREPFDHFKEL